MITSKPKKPLKRSYISSQSKSQRSILIKQADRIFSIYIRLKDSLNGMARCVTCGAIGNWKAMQNGHYLSRRKMAVRYDEQNCHVQCPKCNMELHGNLPRYKIYLLSKYGPKIIDKLNEKVRTGTKVTESDLKSLIKYYTDRIKEFEDRNA